MNTSARDNGGPQSLVILGATGSIGASSLDVLARHPGRFSIFALTAHNSVDALLQLCLRHRPAFAVLSGKAEDPAVRRQFRDAGCGSELLFGPDALKTVAAHEGCRTVIAAIVGAAGLPATLAAAAAGKRLLLANKEALVMAGDLFMNCVATAGAVLLPIDSEHNAVFQCFPRVAGSKGEVSQVRRIILTASGGPFRTVPLELLTRVTPDQACAHPNWVMGRKISVDSATMLNKGLEVIEAKWLFNVQPGAIEVVVHPQSIVHSMVEYQDGSVLAQMSNADMRVPIAHALGFPERIESGAKPLDLTEIGKLTFERPDAQRFPCLRLAYDALAQGGTAPAVLNAANEIAVEAFLAGRLRFTEIAPVIAETLESVASSAAHDIATVLDADARARKSAIAALASAVERAA